MSTDHDDNAEAIVAFVAGALIGVAATLLFVRAKRNCGRMSQEYDNDYRYDGGDLFV